MDIESRPWLYFPTTVEDIWIISSELESEMGHVCYGTITDLGRQGRINITSKAKINLRPWPLELMPKFLRLPPQLTCLRTLGKPRVRDGVLIDLWCAEKSLPISKQHQATQATKPRTLGTVAAHPEFRPPPVRLVAILAPTCLPCLDRCSLPAIQGMALAGLDPDTL